MGECFFWYWFTRVALDTQNPENCKTVVVVVVVVIVVVVVVVCVFHWCCPVCCVQALDEISRGLVKVADKLSELRFLKETGRKMEVSHC